MDIKEIKNRLTLAMLMQHYGLKADKQSRLKCPFHDDKTPSLQLYYKTQTAFCFSTNCTTHGKAIDVIDFILYYEKLSKHEAIKRAEQICTHYTKTTQQTYLVEVCDESKDKYRFGFGNQEKINEVSGIGNTIDMGDRWLDTRIGRTPKTDLHKSKYPSISPYAYALNNPIIYNDPDGKDAKITINKNVITVTTVIQIYGDAAIQDIVNTYQSGITEKWHLQSDGTNWNYTDPKTNEIYDVVFVTDVKLYKGKEKLNPFIISESWNPTNTDNFIKVSSKQNRSNVRLGDEGVWRSEGRELKDQSGNVIRKMSLAEDNPAAHELGHLLGLRDRYSDEGGVFKGWEGNIMGNSGTGKVEQRNIDAVVEDAVKQYNSSSEKKKGKQFETKIDVAFPDK